MSTGATDRYWQVQALPSVFKHDLLRRYMPQFAGMTGSRALGKSVAFLDGFAGRGRYEDGTPGSAQHILDIALAQKSSGDLLWRCTFVEKDPESAGHLAVVVDEYVRRGVQAVARCGEVRDVLADVCADASGIPLFLFLDPCGLGLPYEELVKLLQGKRPEKWPPTEVLMNFSLDAVRRIAGHINSPNGSESVLKSLDVALGGRSWRQHFADGITDEGVRRTVADFCMNLHRDTNMNIVSIPVQRAPGQKALYHLTFGTRSPHGLWAFGHSAALATQTWWDALDSREAVRDQTMLFGTASVLRHRLEEVETEAVPVIADNLRRLLEVHPTFKVVDHTLNVFGGYYGRVRESTVRAAVKELNRQGGTPSTGVGGKPRYLVVVRP